MTKPKQTPQPGPSRASLEKSGDAASLVIGPPVEDKTDRFDLTALDVILNRVVREMNNLFSTCVEKMVDLIEQKLTTQLGANESELHTVASRVDALERSVIKLTTENDNLKQQNKHLQSQLDQVTVQLDDLAKI